MDCWWFVRTSNPVDILIIPAVVTYNQHVPDTIRSVNKLNLSGSVVGLNLESDPVWYKL